MTLTAQTLLLVHGVADHEAVLLAPPVTFGARRCKIEPALRRAFCKGAVGPDHNLWFIAESGGQLVVLLPLRKPAHFESACASVAALLGAQDPPLLVLDAAEVFRSSTEPVPDGPVGLPDRAPRGLPLKPEAHAPAPEPVPRPS